MLAGVVSVHGVGGSLKSGVVVVGSLLLYKDIALVRAVVVGDNSKDMKGHIVHVVSGYMDRVAAGCCCIDCSMLYSMSGYLAIAGVPLIDRGKESWIC